jgi:hypothetical protein
MKKRIKALYILLIGVFITVFCFLSYHYFFKKVVFYKPFSIEVKGISENEFLKINCIGYSPLGKKQNIENKPSLFTFSASDYIHRKEIVLQIPADISRNISEIIFTYGKNKEVIAKEQIENIALCNICQTNLENSISINLSDIVRPDNSILMVYLTAFLWGGFIRVIYILFFLLLLFISIYLLFRYRKPIVLKYFEKIQYVFSIKMPLFVIVKRNRFLFTFFLLAFFLIIYLPFCKFTGVEFMMNESAYHSSGVNFAKEYGISRIGFIEPIKEYKFTNYTKNLEFNYRLFSRFSGAYYFFNPPAYGVFLGVIYYFGGVDPFLAKFLQLLLLLLIASCLPLLGYRSWGTKGYFCGVLAAFFFIHLHYSVANDLKPQTLLFLLCFLMTYMYQHYLKSTSRKTLIFMALIISIAILTKVALIIFPFLILLQIVYKFLKTHQLKFLYHFLIFLIILNIPILIWSWYASSHNNKNYFGSDAFGKLRYELFNSPLQTKDTAFLNPIIRNNPNVNDLNVYINDAGYIEKIGTYNKVCCNLVLCSLYDTGFVFISSQAKNDAIFHAHNEYIKNGGFDAHWYTDNHSFYNNDKMAGKSSFLRVLNFYIHKPSKIITLPLQKLFDGFACFGFLTVFMLAFIINTILLLIKNKVALNNVIKIISFFILNSIILLPLFFEWTRLMYYITLFAFFISLLIYIYMRKKEFFKIPLPFILIFVSQILLTVLVSSNERFSEVIDFIFIISGIYAILYMNNRWIFSGISFKDMEQNKLSGL